MNDALLKPFRKLLSSHLDELTPSDQGGWNLVQGPKVLDIDNVWLQGDVHKISQDSQTLELVDGQGPGVLVVECQQVPGNVVSCSLQDHYCQVLGQIEDRDVHNRIRVRAIKIVDLNELANHSVLKRMWPIEVQELLDHGP